MKCPGCGVHADTRTSGVLDKRDVDSGIRRRRRCKRCGVRWTTLEAVVADSRRGRAVRGAVPASAPPVDREGLGRLAAEATDLAARLRALAERVPGKAPAAPAARRGPPPAVDDAELARRIKAARAARSRDPAGQVTERELAVAAGGAL